MSKRDFYLLVQRAVLLIVYLDFEQIPISKFTKKSRYSSLFSLLPPYDIFDNVLGSKRQK